MTITRRGLADEIDRLDDQLAEIQADKAEMFRAYREQLEKDGTAKPEIAVEVAAIKAAIRRRRAMADDPTAVENKDALIDAIYVEISGASQRGTVSATRARAQRAKARTSESMTDAAELAREMAAEGLISEEAAEETVRIANGIAKKFGTGSGEDGAPPAGGSPPPQTAPVPAAAASALPTTKLSLVAEESAAETLELGAPDRSLPASALQGSISPPVTTELPCLGSEAEGRQPQMFAEHGITAVPPPVIWKTPELIEIDLTDIPPELLRSDPRCWVRPEVRPP